MADACKLTAGAGGGKGLETALGSTIKGKCESVESDLPEDITEKCVLCFEAAVSNHMNIGDAIKKVQNDPLKAIDEVFKGQRYKGSIKFDYGDKVVTINVNKFAGGNSQSSAGIGTRSSVCPDPFMGKLSDPNMNRR